MTDEPPFITDEATARFSARTLAEVAMRVPTAAAGLLSKLAELTLPLRAEAAESDLLHPVCDSSQQQFAAEVRRASAL